MKPLTQDKNEQGQTIISRLRLKVSPGAKRNAVGVWHDGALKIYVTTAPEKGKANEAVIALLSDILRLSKSSLTVVSGHTNSQKVVEVKGLNLQDIEKIIVQTGV